MNNDLFERVLIQLQPELAQEFGKTIIEDEKKLKENQERIEELEELNNAMYLRHHEDRKKLKALEIIKEHKLLNYVLKNEKCANMYHLSEREKDILKKGLL